MEVMMKMMILMESIRMNILSLNPDLKFTNGILLNLEPISNYSRKLSLNLKLTNQRDWQRRLYPQWFWTSTPTVMIQPDRKRNLLKWITPTSFPLKKFTLEIILEINRITIYCKQSMINLFFVFSFKLLKIMLKRHRIRKTKIHD